MSLFNNAVESIQVGVEDYLMNDDRRYLSAVRNICAGILLLYKEKLCRLSPNDEEILIKKDIRPSYDDEGNVIFIGKGTKTVDVQEIKERFSSKSLNVKVDWEKFDDLNKLRNEIEHYYTNKSPDAVREIVAKSFILIRDFISEHLEEEPRRLLGDECWQTFLETADVYTAEENFCRNSLEQIDWKYQTLKKALKKIRCPDCHSSLIKSVDEGDYDIFTSLVCSSCGKEFDFGDVVEQCLSDSLAAETYTSIKDGGEAPIGQCPGCDRDTYMLVEEHCAACDYEMEYLECDMCGQPLSLDEQDFDGYCSYCQHKLDKLMAE
jgi:DNA-directed RNA polymerase subunit RPC12/RpoP